MLDLGGAQARILLDISDLAGNAARAKGMMDDLDGSAGRTNSTFGKLKNTALGFGTALIAPMTIGLKGAVSLEQGIANVNASLGGVDTKTLDAMGKMFQQVGADSKFAAVDVAKVTDELAKAGFTVDQIMAGMPATIVNIAQATGESLDVATSGVVSAMALWNPAVVGMETGLTDVTRVADIFVGAANLSAGGVADINAGLANFGPAAAAAKMDFADTAAAIAYFTTMGYGGAEAGTGLARSLQFLANPTEEATGWMERMGVQAYDTYGNFIGFPALFDQLHAGMGNLTSEEQQRAFKSMFGAEAYKVMLAGAMAGGGGLRDLRGELDKTGVAAEQSQLRMNTLGAQFETLKEGVTNFLASLVMGLLPGLRMLVDGANTVIDVLMKIPGPIKTIIGAVAGMLAGWAAISHALTAFRALNMIMTALSGSSAAAAGGAGLLGGALLPIIAIVAAAGAAFLAYRNNFMGFADVVKNAIGDIQGFGSGVAAFIDRFTSAWDGLKPAADVAESVMSKFDAMGSGLDKATKPLQVLSKAVSSFLKPAAKVGDAISAVAKPIAAVSKGFQALTSPVRSFTNSLLAIAGITDRVTNKFDAVGTSLYAIYGPLSSVQRLITALAIAFQGINAEWAQKLADGLLSTSKIVGKLQDDFTVLGGALKDLLSGNWSDAVTGFANAWDGISSTLGSVAIAIGSVLGGLVLDLGSWTLNVGVPAVTGWIADHAGDIWGAISSAAGWAGDVTGQLVGWTLDVGAPKVGGWIKVAAGNTWDAIRALAGGLNTMTGSILSWTLNVGIPKLGGWIVSAASSSVVSMILALIGDVVVTLGEWTLVVGAPQVRFTAWTAAGEILKSIRENVLVPLNDWILTVTAPQLIYEGLSLTQTIGAWVNENVFSIPLKAWTLIIGLPLFLLAGPIGLGAALALWMLGKIPASVKYEAALTIQMAGNIVIAGASLAGQVLLWVADQIGLLGVINATIQVGIAAIDLITTGVSLIAKAALWVADQLAAGVNATMRITVGAVEWVGDTAKSLFGAGMGLVGTITAKFPEFPDWPDWPALPTWKWPEIPTPGWVQTLVDLFGGGGPTEHTEVPTSSPGGTPDNPATPYIPPFAPSVQRITLELVDNASAKIGEIKDALLGVPPTKITTVQQQGAEGVMSLLGLVTAAVDGIPTSHYTSITESGGSAVVSSANAAMQAINDIPLSHHTELTIAGEGAVISAANAAQAAINAVQGKTVYIDVVTTGGVPRATGGTINEPLTRLADGNGPELLRYPSGKLGMAMVDGIYSMPRGTYVYTAEQTRALMKQATGINAFASGGTVGGWSSIGSAIGNIRGLKDSKQFNDMVKALRDLTEGTRKNNRALVSTLTNYQDQLAKYTENDMHPAGALAASRQLGAAIKAFTTGGTFRLNGMTESYGLADRYYGRTAKSAPRTPNKTPNSGGNRPQQLTTLETHYHITSLKSDELVQVLDGAQKGSHVYKELSKLPQRRQTSNLRTVGSS